MKTNKLKKVLFLILCLSPAFIFYILFMIVPTFSVFYYSLYKWDGLSGEKTFNGINNFKILFTNELVSPKFLYTVKNTLFLIGIVSILTIFFALLYASILTSSKVKGKSFFRIVFYIPNILAIVVIGTIFNSIFAVEPEYGIINSLLSIFPKFKAEPIPWLGNGKTVFVVIISAMVWQAIGYYMVMYIASMSSVPTSLYEAAALEGCSKYKMFTQITLPLIWDVIRTTLTFFVISTINIGYVMIQYISSAGPNNESQDTLNYIMSMQRNGTYGFAMAGVIVLFCIAFGLSTILNKITDRESVQF